MNEFRIWDNSQKLLSYKAILSNYKSDTLYFNNLKQSNPPTSPKSTTYFLICQLDICKRRRVLPTAEQCKHDNQLLSDILSEVLFCCGPSHPHECATSTTWPQQRDNEECLFLGHGRRNVLVQGVGDQLGRGAGGAVLAGHVDVVRVRVLEVLADEAQTKGADFALQAAQADLYDWECQSD